MSDLKIYLICQNLPQKRLLPEKY